MVTASHALPGLVLVKGVETSLPYLNGREKNPLAYLPEEGFVRIDQVLAVFPVSRSAWYAGMKAGNYPAPVHLGPRTVAWRVEDIRALIASRTYTNLGTPYGHPGNNRPELN